ncbi:MAG: cytochrome C oxidase subunit IV family protein [Acidimicrobiales bacterium]
MSTTTTDTAPAPEAASADEEHVHAHPSDGQYVKIALILGAITAAEVATYFWEGATTVGLVLVLFPMMIAKFAIVTGYFMHLKYDNPLFKRVFVFGLVLAVTVFMIALFAFDFWSDDYLKYLR